MPSSLMSAPDTGKPRHSLLGILAFLGRYPVLTAGAIGLLFFMIGLEMALPQVIGQAITALRARLASGAPFSPVLYTEIFMGIVVVREITRFVLGRVRNRLIQRTLADIRCAIYDAMQRLPFSYHDNAYTGELISRSTTDVWNLQEFLVACLLLSLDIGLSLLLTLALLFWTSAALGWATLATMAPTVALLAYFARRLHPQWRLVHDRHADLTTVVQENIAGVRVVKAFAKEPEEVRKFGEKQAIFHKTLLDTVSYWAARVPMTQFVFGLGLPLVLFMGGRQVIAGTLPIGDLAKAVLYLLAIGFRVALIGRVVSVMQNANASAERVLEIIRAPREIRGGARSLPGGPGAVRFDHVSYQKRDSRSLLDDVNFEARPGETVAVVGATGAGKTTLVNMIPRFYEATSGRVLIEGIDVRELKLDELRRAVGVVFQESFLFSATVAENIAYGRPTAGRSEIEAAAQASQAHGFISLLENGYDTVIGERGVSLSGGQKQRLAIARAFLTNPRILILDDATASVDSKTERLIQEAMRRLTAGRTTFIIANRLSTVKHADRVIVLDKGRIVEMGTPHALTAHGGHYHTLFLEQRSRTARPQAAAA